MLPTLFPNGRPGALLGGTVLAASLLALAPSSAAAQARTRITITGSQTMGELDRELAQSYAAREPAIRFAVTDDGSETGIRALLEGRTDIAASSRRMTPAESSEYAARNGSAPREVVIGLHGIGVYVHTSNPVLRLTVDELRGILAGEIRNWREVGGLNRPIDVYNRNDSSGTRAWVQEHVLGGAAFSELARDVSSSALLMAAVSNDPRAIGYSGFTNANEVRMVRIARDADSPAFKPGPETVLAGDYPLSRPLYYYLSAQSDARLSAFVDWVLSPEGQYIVGFVGYFPAHPTAADDGASIDVEELVQITPENMQALGFKLVVGVFDAERPGQREVSILFAPSGAAIRGIGEVALVIADEARVPLALDDDLSLSFSVRDAVLSRTSVELVERGGPDAEPRTYVVRLADFHGARR